MKHFVNDPLYVVAVLSNPRRYGSRYRLFKNFVEYVKKFPGAKLYTVEMQTGERTAFVSGSGIETDDHLLLRSYEEIWHKENMINLGMKRLPHDWKYVAWIDADVEFVNPNWVEETIHALQHYMIVQMFQTAVDQGPTGEAMKIHNSFLYRHLQGGTYVPGGGKYYVDWHPGFAWAARREAIDAVGGLIDTGVLGSGDHHMAAGLIGRAEVTVQRGIHPDYASSVFRWQDRAIRHIKKDVGFVPGTLIHHWHGKKVDRGYDTRWKILRDHQFSPVTDLKKDWQGLWQLCDDEVRQIRLRDAIRRYFTSRNEDSIDP